jgi:hypothetical protein
LVFGVKEAVAKKAQMKKSTAQINPKSIKQEFYQRPLQDGVFYEKLGYPSKDYLMKVFLRQNGQASRDQENH